jgi:uncharacterized oxidoreductase
VQTRRMAAHELEGIGTRLFDAAGSPHEESKLVSEILVRSSLMGHDSHGILRFPQYVKGLRDKEIVPASPFDIVEATTSFAVVDGHFGWGQLVAKKAMELTIEKARESGVGTVVVRNCMHIGRLGEYSSMPATVEMMGSVLVNAYGGKDMVAPWGGIEPRLSANPVSWAAPTGYVWPFLVDITTSVVPEGKVRVALNAGKQLPEGCLIDHQGNPTTNPADLYPPNGGAILTFGGIVGHKGYGLNLVAEMFAGALSGMGCRGQGNSRDGNGVFLQAIDIGRFLPVERFIESVQGFIAHVKSCRTKPGVKEILIPGEVEYQTQKRLLEEGIPVSEGTWKEIEESVAEFGVAT